MEWDWERLKKRQESKKVPDLQGFMKNMGGFKAKLPGGTFGFIVALALLIWAYTCVYTIKPDEVGVIQRFGKFVRLSQPGLNFKLPSGIEKVTKVKTKYVFKEEFGFRTIEPGIRTTYATKGAFEAEALMLTGDLNVAVVPWVVQYRVADPSNYLFKVHNVRATLRDLSEATMRLVVGDRNINEVISKREEISREAMDVLQKELDKAETGIKIVTIEMKRTNVPEPVQPSFNEVNQALQEKERTIYQAKEEYNKAIPAARGQAEKIVSEAEGYALERVNKARGDVSRFMAIYKEYTKAPEVTKKRLYFETISDVMEKAKSKVLIDDELKGLLPVWDLSKSKGKEDQK